MPTRETSLALQLRGAWVASTPSPTTVDIDAPRHDSASVAGVVARAIAPFLLHGSDGLSFETVETETGVVIQAADGRGDDARRPAGLRVALTASDDRYTAVEVSGETNGYALDPSVARSMADRIGARLGATDDSPTQPPRVTRVTDRRSLTDAVLAHAGKDPARVAVDAPGDVLSYRELVDGAVAYTNLLDRRDMPWIVAVPFRRTAATITTLLGVLLSGRAYLLLNEADSEDYRRDVMDRVGAGLAPDHASALVEGEGSPRHDVLPRTGPRDPAYVIFTSGTTGRPKAVLVSRASLDHYCDFLAEAGLCGPEITMPLLSAPGFDAIIKQIWGQLRCGGTVRIPADPDILRAVQDSVGVDGAAINTVPSVWREVLGTLDPTDATGTIMLGGEVLPPGLVRETRDRLPGMRLVNLYGPSEATSNAAWHVVDVLDRDVVPIGSGIPGAVCIVADEQLAPVPFGAVGALHIAGDGVAEGYLGGPRRTASAFLPCEVEGMDAARMYATGDLVRETSDGLVFLGRVDDVVKVNGVLADLTALTADVESLPSVGAAVVDAQDGMLHVHVVPAYDDADVAVNDYIERGWRAELRPVRIHTRTSIPRTTSGKADVAALRAATDVDAGSSATEPGKNATSDAAPESPHPVDAVLQALWGHALGADGPLPVDRTFTSLGGTSLKSLKLVALYRRLLKVDLGLQDFSADDTIAGHRELLHGLVGDAELEAARVTLGRGRS